MQVPSSKQCPLCHNKEIVLLHDRVWHMDEGKVFRCRNCQAAFIHPFMSDDEEKSFYDSYNEHVKARGVTLTTDCRELHQKSKAIASERFSLIRPYFNETDRVLEIGSATGAFLELVSAPHCFCVEPDDSNRNFSKQFVDKAYKSLEEIPLSEHFDTICMFHVFEHIRNPIQFLERCKNILSDNGKIVVEVPHIEDPLLSLYDIKEFKDFYFQAMHPFIYSLKALRYAFQTASFTEQNIIYYQRYGLDNHLTWLKHGRPGGDIQFTQLFSEVTDYKRKLESEGKTDTILYIAGKS